MKPFRAAVIGVGHLGKHHAAKYANSVGAELVGVVDTDPGRRDAVARQLGVPGFADHREILGQIDCVSIAVPTPQHYAIARDCLGHGVDVLVYSKKINFPARSRVVGLVDLDRVSFV